MANTDGNYLKHELFELISSDEKLFDFVQDSALDGIWYWNLEQPEHEWFSPKFWQTLGYDPDEKKHLAAEWQDIINADDLNLAKENLRRHCENPSYPYDQIVRYTHSNGSTVWVRCRGIAIRDDEGKAIRMFGSHIDVTNSKELENKYKRNLRELDRLYADIKLSYEESENLFEMAPDAILKIEEDGTIIKANIQASNLFGYSKDELMSMKVSSLMPIWHRETHDKHIQHYFKSGGLRRMGNERGKLTALKKNGDQLSVEITLNLIDTRYGKRALATIRDVTDREMLIEALEKKIQENEELAQLSLTDSLTNTYNKRFFDDALDKEFSKSQRHRQPLSLMVIDLDHFKAVNDNYGHDAGDIALQQTANLLLRLVRFFDIVCRIGGEEFAIILPNTDIDSAMALADRICDETAEYEIEIGKKLNIKLTLSIGVSSLCDDDKQYTDLFSRADKALYNAKQQGRNRTASA